MRHQRSGKKLGRSPAHRKALYSNLAGALIEHGRISTTEAKAKAVPGVLSAECAGLFEEWKQQPGRKAY